MTEDWLEHVELPNGQSADLLKRYPYERATMIEQARERDMTVTQALLAQGGTKVAVQRMTVTGFVDSVLRASLWSARLKHSLTGDDIDASQVGMADDKLIKDLRNRAMKNYVDWYDEAYSGPKDSSGTDSPTPPSANPEPSETGESG